MCHLIRIGVVAASAALIILLPSLTHGQTGNASKETVPSSTTIPAEGGDIVITAVMHASVQIEHTGKVIQVDPALGDASKLKPADLILVTDVHDDHMNPTRIARLRKSRAPVVMPLAVQQAAGIRISEPRQILANGQRRTIAGVPIEAVASYNIVNQMDGEPFHTKGRANGYVITLGGKRLFFAGDTECVPEIRALKNIDVAFLPMNLPFTMPPAEAAECVKAFKPKLALPYHFQGEDPGLFVAAVKDSGIETRMLNWYPTIEVPDVIAMERPGVLVQAGDRRLHVHCTGRGQPTVLLEASSGLALDWFFVQPDVAQTTRVCSYDRPGFGWSDPIEGLSRMSEAVKALHAALAAAGEKPPFVFVGAGDGVLAARTYALEFPAEVSGLVFVEGFHEDAIMVPIDGKPAPVWTASAEQLVAILKQFQPPPNAPPPPVPPPSTDAPFDRLPANVLTTRMTFERRSQNAEFGATFEQRAEVFEDSRQLAVKLHEVGGDGMRPLGSRPLVVLVANASATAETAPIQDKLAALSNNSLKRVVASAGPQIHLWSPRAVVQAIQDVVASVQKGSPVPAR